MTREQRFQELAEEMGLDEFERVAAWDLLEQLRERPGDAGLYMRVGALLSDRVDEWVGR